LGMGNATAMITIFAHEKCNVPGRDALALTLDVLEDKIERYLFICGTCVQTH
jgi:hypothetical protein